MLPPVLYPPVQTTAWVVISRLSEKVTRTVPNLQLLNHAEEFALPLPTGVYPEKVIERTFDAQKFDDLGNPVYWDGVAETIEQFDVDGNAYPPHMEEITEEELVSLDTNPDEFSVPEVFSLVLADFLTAFPFYDTGHIHIFSPDYDTIIGYGDYQETQGLASGSHPVFLGPIQMGFDTSSDPRGHLLVVAPEILGVSWYFQIRHGVPGPVGGNSGPILDIGQASRQGEVHNLYPMENLEITEEMLLDGADNEVTYFWIRSSENGSVVLERPFPVIPFMVFLMRNSGTSGV